MKWIENVPGNEMPILGELVFVTTFVSLVPNNYDYRYIGAQYYYPELPFTHWCRIIYPDGLSGQQRWENFILQQNKSEVKDDI